jgi:hypothetical protein
MRLKPAIVLLPLLLGTWGATNHQMTCWFQQKPREWYVKRAMWFRKETLGIPLGSPDEVLEAWIRNHPDCCFVKPTELDPIKRILHGSDVQVLIFLRDLTPTRQDRPYETIEWTLSPCGFVLERSGRSELPAKPPTFPGYPFDSIEPWRVRL